MDVTVGGITAMDRMELERALDGHHVEFKEDDTAQHGQGDMGIFTIVVPLTAAVVQVLNAWIKHRTPITTVEITEKGGRKRKITAKGAESIPVLQQFYDSSGRSAE